MAVLTAQGISRTAIKLLTRQLVLPRTVTIVSGDEFSGGNGDSITLRVPQVGAARVQASAGAALTADDVTEIPQVVVMRHLYHLKNLTDQEVTFNLENFATQVSKVQVDAVARGVEDEIVSAMNAIASEDAVATFSLAGSEADTKAQILKIREHLSVDLAPADERYLAVSPQVMTRLLSVADFTRNDAIGGGALRDAVIGRILGFDVIEVPGLTSGTAVAYHKSGFALAVRAPVNPKGATSSFGTSEQGVGMRQVFQYNASTATDQSLISTFAGAKAVNDDAANTVKKRYVKIDTATV